MEKKWQWNFTKCLKYIISPKTLYLLKLAALVLFKSTYCFKEKRSDDEFKQFEQIFHMVMFITIIIVLTVIVIWFCVAVIFLLIRTLITLRTPIRTFSVKHLNWLAHAIFTQDQNNQLKKA